MNYFLPPSIGKTQIVRNIPRPAIVNTGDFGIHRVVTVYFSSKNPCNNSGATDSNFVSNLASPIRNVVAVKFISVQLDYLPEMKSIPNQTAFIWLFNFPREGEDVYHETADGVRYSSRFPLPSTRMCDRRIHYEYVFQDDYCLDTSQKAQTVQKLHFKILFEDSTTGVISEIPASKLSLCDVELGFVVQENI